MGLTVEVLDAAHRRAEGHWDKFVVEHDLPAYWQAGPVHAYARCAREVVLLARAELDGETVAVASFRGVPRPGRARFRDLSSPPRPFLLRCAVPVAFSSGLAFAATLDHEDRARVLAELGRAVRRRLAPWCRGIVYESITASDLELFSSRIMVRQTPFAVLEVQWDGLDAYLASLPGTRRRRFGALLARLAGDPSIAAFDSCPTIDPVEATRLDLSTRLRHAPTRAVPLPLGYVAALSATGRATFFGFRRVNGPLLQFDIVLPAAGRLVTTVTGAEDRSVASDLYSALFLREIAYAAAHGVDALDFGPGSIDEKLRFGCAMEDRYAFIL